MTIHFFCASPVRGQITAGWLVGEDGLDRGEASLPKHWAETPHPPHPRVSVGTSAAERRA